MNLFSIIINVIKVYVQSFRLKMKFAFAIRIATYEVNFGLDVGSVENVKQNVF